MCNISTTFIQKLAMVRQSPVQHSSNIHSTIGNGSPVSCVTFQLHLFNNRQWFGLRVSCATFQQHSFCIDFCFTWPVNHRICYININKILQIILHFKDFIIPYSTIPYAIIPYSILPYYIIPYSIIQYSIIPYSMIACSIIAYSIIPYSIIPTPLYFIFPFVVT